VTCHALASQDACVVVADLGLARPRPWPRSWGGPDVAAAVEIGVADKEAIKAGIAVPTLALGGLDLAGNKAGLFRSAALGESSSQLWDLQRSSGLSFAS
jgi:NAD(P)-dependent dehydrogenase (short-subunit alcohol dehydrogenase family)